MTEPREQYRGWNVPLPATLKRYGGTVEQWKAIIDKQYGLCPICLKVPTTGRGVIDHEHAKGWAKMTDAMRWAHVRGVTDWWCNSHLLGRGITYEKASRMAWYLLRYAMRMGRT